jgi:hypothetical protein
MFITKMRIFSYVDAISCVVVRTLGLKSFGPTVQWNSTFFDLNHQEGATEKVCELHTQVLLYKVLQAPITCHFACKMLFIFSKLK